MIALLVTASGLKDVAKWISEKTLLQHFRFFFKVISFITIYS
jgi:hypothetical protein